MNRFPWLFDELGFQISAHNYSYKHMGSSFAIIESSSIRVKFVNDRSSIYLEVASPSDPERWMELGFLWMTLTHESPSPQLDGWACFLRDHIAELKEALGPDLTLPRQPCSKMRKHVRKRWRSSARPLARASTIACRSSFEAH